jgi:hypothetical protein
VCSMLDLLDPNADWVELVDHWCVYPGQPQHEKSLGSQLEFLREHFPL